MSSMVTGMDEVSLMVTITSPTATITTNNTLNLCDTILNNVIIIK